jgi:hypothetical protein
MACTTKWACPPPPKLSTKVQACHNLFDIDMLVQDMTFTATKMTATSPWTPSEETRFALTLQKSD